MEKNIFEGAKFGDKYITKDNLNAIYLSHGTTYHGLVVKNKDNSVFFIQCINNGADFSNRDDKHDIVSCYKEPEPINEQELDQLANTYCRDIHFQSYVNPVDIYKAGFNKAKEK